MAISHCYWHLVVKNANFTLLLTSSGQEWQFYTATDILWSRMAISHCYRHLVVRNGNFTLLLTSSWQLLFFATDHLHDKIHFMIYQPQLHFWCSEAQAISTISPKTCTLKLQLLQNTKRPTMWSGHVKIIDPQRTSTYERPFT